MMKRFAVTGSHGFLGSAVCSALRARHDDESIVPVARSQGASSRVYDTIPECEVLFHVGGGSSVANAMAAPILDLRAHVHSAIEILESARRGDIGVVVLASSAAVYGKFDGVVSEAAPTEPVSAYGASKLAAETYLATYSRQFGIDGRIARIANPYGPGQRRYVIFDLGQRAISGAPPLRLRGTGTEVRDFVFVEDAVEALLTIAERGARGGAYNIGSGEPVELLKVAQLVAAAAGLPSDCVQVDGHQEPGKVQTFVCATDKIRSLGWIPKTALATGINATVMWLRKEMECAG